MSAYRGAILDVDGTIVLGDQSIPGAADAVDVLRDAGLDLLLFSNNPTKRRDHYADRLADHGIEIDPSRFLTAATVTAEYLDEHHAGDDLLVVGEPGLEDLLVERDLALGAGPDDADAVVASIDREFHYDRLTEALWALEDDSAAFLSTDPDVTIPVEDHLVPGSGAIVGAIEAATGRQPDRVLGKPADTAIDAALERLGVPPESVLVVGDRLDTDIALGERAGMTTALVLTGVTDREDIDDAEITPDHVLESIAEVEELL
ncbi:4-nitrophenyl phosphatase [Natronoarchaeum philippinense]|uniref:4-nitrophenyl phosphatase n=1 Tax=Natronoarchaeum philippinense TaxID=558529 RepID=A0A285N1G3_NATPI|nr:HAD-IIA family hydrolase [Natronoarchaeum philippinense]SNZ03315.1 4-nitrophenyl phosphatase [Natronoarchaeum philippinense]